MKRFDGAIKYFEPRDGNFAICMSPGLWEFELKKESLTLELRAERAERMLESFIGRQARIWCDENSFIYEIEVEEINAHFKYAKPWIVFWTIRNAGSKKLLIPMKQDWRNRLVESTKSKLMNLVSRFFPTLEAYVQNHSPFEHAKLEEAIFIWAKQMPDQAIQATLTDLIELAPGLFSSVAHKIISLPKSEIEKIAQSTKSTFEEDSRMPDLISMFNILARAMGMRHI